MDIPKFLSDSGILVVPLLACSLIGGTVVLERLYFWTLQWFRMDEETRRYLASGDTRIVQTKDPVARVLRGLLERPGEPSLAQASANRLIRDSRSNLRVLNWVATLSTSLGLLGTVIGVSMSLKDLDDPAKLTAGLSVALNTTIIGLVIYLVTFSFATLFAARSAKLAAVLKELLDETARSLGERTTSKTGRPLQSDQQLSEPNNVPVATALPAQSGG